MTGDDTAAAVKEVVSAAAVKVSSSAVKAVSGGTVMAWPKVLDTDGADGAAQAKVYRIIQEARQSLHSLTQAGSITVSTSAAGEGGGEGGGGGQQGSEVPGSSTFCSRKTLSTLSPYQMFVKVCVFPPSQNAFKLCTRCVSMLLCMYMCIYVHVYVCTCVCMYMCMYVHVYVCMYMYMYVYVSKKNYETICMYICTI